MSSTTTTEFYGLTQYIGTDKPSFTDNNEAFRNIDGDLHEAVVGVGDNSEAIVGIRATVASLSGAVVTLQSDLDTEKGKIVALQSKETLQDTEIADVKADAQNMITAYVEATATSTHAYSAGDFFIYNDVLYKATDTIGIGDTIVPDTNCTTDNVTTELLAIMTDLSDKANSTDLAVSSDSTSLTGAYILQQNKNIEIDFQGAYADDIAAFTLPESKRPQHDVRNACLIVSESQTYLGLIRVRSTGVISIQALTTYGSSLVDVTSHSSQVYGQIKFFIP